MKIPIQWNIQIVSVQKYTAVTVMLLHCIDLGYVFTHRNSYSKGISGLLYCCRSLQHSVFVLQMAPAVELLLQSYPDYIKVDDFPMAQITDKVCIVWVSFIFEDKATVS